MSCVCCKSKDTVDVLTINVKQDIHETLHTTIMPSGVSSRQHCGPCLTKRKFEFAVSFCEDCVAYLCKECLQLHRKTQVTRSHRITLNIDAFEDDKYVLLDKGTLLQDLNDLKVKYQVEKDTSHGLLNERNKQIDEAVNSVKEVRLNINMLLDKLEKVTVDEIKTVAGIEIGNITKHISDITACIDELNLEIKRVAKANKNREKHEPIFQRAVQTIKEYTTKREDIEKVEDVSITFVGNAKIETLFNNIGMLGDVRTEATTAWLFSDLTADLEETFDTKVGAERNTKGYWITGLAVNQNGKIIVSDQRNNTIKMFDIGYRHLDTLKLEHRPFDVAVVSVNNAVCTLPYRNRVHFLTLTETTILSDVTTTDIHTRGECYGIEYYDEHLIVGIRDTTTFTSRINIMDFSGVITASLSHNTHGDQLFADPQNLTVDHRRGVIYVSDQEKKHIVIANADGTYVSTVPIAAGFPLGVDVDMHGNVCMCHSSGEIQAMTRDGLDHRTLLMSRHGIRNPQALCFDVSRRHFLISMAGSPYVKAYSLHSVTEQGSDTET